MAVWQLWAKRILSKGYSWYEVDDEIIFNLERLKEDRKPSVTDMKLQGSIDYWISWLPFKDRAEKTGLLLTKRSGGGNSDRTISGTLWV